METTSTNQQEDYSIRKDYFTKSACSALLFIFVASITVMNPTNDAQGQNVLFALKADEANLKNQVPSFAMPGFNKIPSPTKLFADYQKTGDPLFYSRAADARQQQQQAVKGIQLDPLNNQLTITGDNGQVVADSGTGAIKSSSIFGAMGQAASDLGTKVKSMLDPQVSYNRDTQVQKLVPQQVPDKFKDLVFDYSNKYQVDPALLGTILMKESSGNPSAIRLNNNKTIDRGLMQINSVNSKDMESYFASKGQIWDPFNPSMSIEAGARMLHSIQSELTQALGRTPTQQEVSQAYNLGVTGFLKSISGDKNKKELADKYTQGMFQ